MFFCSEMNAKCGNWEEEEKGSKIMQYASINARSYPERMAATVLIQRSSHATFTQSQ